MFGGIGALGQLRATPGNHVLGNGTKKRSFIFAQFLWGWTMGWTMVVHPGYLMGMVFLRVDNWVDNGVSLN